MADQIDDILASGCLEKIIENEKELNSIEELTSYLSENGFNEVSDEDKTAIIEEIKALESSTGGGFSVIKSKANVKAKQTCYVDFTQGG